jgi:hypothetical protein
VHHGSNPIYIDKNFGGVFIVWDRLFGTYQPETEKVNYGLTTGFLSYNPFVLVFEGFIDWFKPHNPPAINNNSTSLLAVSPQNTEQKLQNAVQRAN